MDYFVDQAAIIEWIKQLQVWVQAHVLTWETLLQLAVLLVVRILGYIFAHYPGAYIKSHIQKIQFSHFVIRNIVHRFTNMLSLVVSAILLLVAIGIFDKLGFGIFLMRLVLNLTVAWIIIKLTASVMLNRYWSRVVALLVFFLAALNIIGLFDSLISILQTVGFSIGKTRLTLFSVIQAVIIFLVLLQVVKWLNKQLEKRLINVPGLNSSTRLILIKISNITMVVLVTLIVLNSIGIDFSSLAFLSGAIGVGVGFGLQKIVGNYISGLILLSDKSIKPGDVIQLSDAYGWVRFMGGRYVSVVTLDEKEYLIPNEDLITQQVVNWSYSNKTVRVKVPFGVTYKADPHKVIELVTTSIVEVDRILSDPEPKCLLTSFGDSSVNLELRFWINDPQKGVANITSVALLKIWDVLKENDIEIPFPQRDVHIKS